MQNNLFENHLYARASNLSFLTYQIATSLTPLYLFNSKIICTIGTGAIYACIVFVLIETFCFRCRIIINRILRVYLYVSFSIIVLFFINFDKSSLMTTLVQLSLLYFVAIFSTKILNENCFRLMVALGRFACFMMFLFVVVVRCLENCRSQDFFRLLVSPVILKCLFISSFYFLLDVKYFFGRVLFFSFVLFLLGERGSSLSLFIFMAVRMILKRINRVKINKRRLFLLKLIFFVYMFSVLIMPIIYVQLWKSPFALDLQEFSMRLTGGNFFSGRQNIWGLALDFISTRPVVGYGIGGSVLTSRGIQDSTHNLYLNILLEGGIVYLLAFVWLMYVIWTELTNNHMSDRGLFFPSFLISILAAVSFENYLLGNMVSPSLIVWMIVGMGLALNNKVKREEQILS